MNRMALAQKEIPTSGTDSVEIVFNGVSAICDPFGALFFPEQSLLLVSDLHLEKGAAFARRGQLLPPYDTLATLRLLETVIARHDPQIVVSLGDNFHDRKGSALLPDVFRTMIQAMARGREWVWIAGNHDPDGTVDLPGVSVEELAYAGLVFRHEPSRTALPGEISGHLHPSATVRRSGKSVRRPCFATDGARLIMPSFGVLTGGLDLRHKAFTGLFNRHGLIAHLLGRDRIYSVRFANLLG